MRRIKATGCGYSLDPGRSYTCNGLPKLKSSFGTTNMDTATETDWLSVIDNYNNVPQQIEGFIMTLTPILDMSGGSANNIEVPELDCRVNFDPFMDMPGSVLKTEAGYTSIEATQDTGFVDMFDNGPGIRPNTKYRDDVYVDVNGSTYNIFIGPSGPAFLPAFTTNGTSYIMRPGILEPMVDTTFTPISIDVNPPTFDGTNTAIAILNKWRVEADKRFRDIYNKIRPWSYDDSNVKGHLGLQDALNKEGPCDNFAITMITGTPLMKLVNGEIHSPPSYSVDAGTIKINGTTVTVPAISAAVSAPFKAYLDVVGNTASIQTSTHMPLSGNGHKYVYIGEVREVKNNQESDSQNPLFGGGSLLSLYQIIQGDCITEIGDGTPVGGDYEGPFKVRLKGSTTYLISGETVTDNTVVGSPEIGTVVDRDYTANIYEVIDGADSILDVGTVSYAGYCIAEGIRYTSIPEKIYSVDSTSTATIYIVATRVGNYWNYVYRALPNKDKPSADIDPETQQAKEQYWVPIGCIDGGTIGQIQYGDIYLDVQKIPDIPTPSYQYTGPFKVTAYANATDATKVDITISGPDEDTDTNHTPRAGYVCINGEDCHLVKTGTITGATIGSFIFARITGTNVNDIYYDDGTPASNIPATPPYYTVRLAKITGVTSAEQYHYGDIYVDGRWS